MTPQGSLSTPSPSASLEAQGSLAHEHTKPRSHKKELKNI